jgi:hypothetical protein
MPRGGPLGLSKPYTTKAKEWFVKELEVEERYKVLFINEFGEQRVMYKTKLERLGVRYFT